MCSIAMTAISGKTRIYAGFQWVSGTVRNGLESLSPIQKLVNRRNPAPLLGLSYSSFGHGHNLGTLFGVIHRMANSTTPTGIPQKENPASWTGFCWCLPCLSAIRRFVLVRRQTHCWLRISRPSSGVPGRVAPEEDWRSWPSPSSLLQNSLPDADFPF